MNNAIRGFHSLFDGIITSFQKSYMLNYILTVTCPSKRGIIAAISGFLSKKSCNILDSSQFDDLDTKFFLCV